MSQRHFVETSGISSDRRHYLSFERPAGVAVMFPLRGALSSALSRDACMS